MGATGAIFIGCVLAVAAVGAIWDVRVHKLPNWLTVPALAAAILFSATSGALEAGWRGLGVGLLFSLAGFATGFGFFLLLWLIGGSGSGDVKFMGALGGWLGVQATFHVIVASALLSAAITVSLLLLGLVGIGPARRRGAGQADRKAARESFLKRRAVPYGVPVALATCMVLAFHIWRGQTPPFLTSWL